MKVHQDFFEAFLDCLTAGLAFDLRVVRRFVGEIHARNISKQATTGSRCSARGGLRHHRVGRRGAPDHGGERKAFSPG